MTRYSLHARKEMVHSEVTERDVERCSKDGRLVAKQIVKGEVRYAKQLETKERKIVVVYAFENGEVKVITCYPIRRKKWWKK